MCENHCDDHPPVEQLVRHDHGVTRYVHLDTLLAYARYIANEPETRRSATGFIGYGSTRPGDRVLIVVDNQYDPRIPDAFARVLRDKGAKVDVMIVDVGPDKEFDEIDEIHVIIRRESIRENPRRWDYIPWVEDFGHLNKYDLVIHGKGSPVPKTPYRYEAIPWLQTEHLASKAAIYPRELNTLINTTMWKVVWDEGRGAKVHLTDLEGTDVTYSLSEAYFDGLRKTFNPNPMWGHLMVHGTWPIVESEDAVGVVRGTTSHFSRPFPRIEVKIEEGQVRKVSGGGRYGDAWRELMDETKNIQYPGFPRPGLFWLQEAAVGTNPKVRRPSNIHLHSSGGFEIERRRSGIIHLGFGTSWLTSAEHWAAENRIAYGHLHVHLLFPTLDITTKAGKTVRLIDKGHLTVLDDPNIRAVAGKYGDPDDLLKEDWAAPIPGITLPGEYEEYARDPVPYIYGLGYQGPGLIREG